MITICSFLRAQSALKTGDEQYAVASNTAQKSTAITYLSKGITSLSNCPSREETGSARNYVIIRPSLKLQWSDFLSLKLLADS